MKKVIMLENKDGVITKNYGNYLALDLTVIHHTIKRQHLYIICTEAKIEKGDWATNGELVIQTEQYNPQAKFGYYYVSMFYLGATNLTGFNKIIASTDPSLGLPLINKEFIELYVEKQGKIEEVNMKIDYSELSDRTKAIVTPKEEVDDVEYPKYISYDLSRKNITDVVSAFKAGADWQRERMYSKDEVIEIIYKSSYVLAHGDSTKHDADEWIAQNLKK